MDSFNFFLMERTNGQKYGKYISLLEQSAVKAQETCNKVRNQSTT